MVDWVAVGRPFVSLILGAVIGWCVILIVFFAIELILLTYYWFGGTYYGGLRWIAPEDSTKHERKKKDLYITLGVIIGAGALFGFAYGLARTSI
jgi:hypothetical protein